jgi:hypothetical protein
MTTRRPQYTLYAVDRQGLLPEALTFTRNGEPWVLDGWLGVAHVRRAPTREADLLTELACSVAESGGLWWVTLSLLAADTPDVGGCYWWDLELGQSVDPFEVVWPLAPSRLIVESVVTDD